jgi:hypothetical protein
MKSLNKLLFNVLIFAVSSFIIGNLGCQSDSPSSPTSGIKPNSTTQLHFLTPSESHFNKAFKVEQNISASSGGTIVVGDEASGYSSLDFMPGDLNYDTIITFRWDDQNYSAEFTPHGINFNNPVRLNLSYKTADVSAINEEALRIWYYNDNENHWELIGGEVDTEKQEVSAYINHFSRYELAGED